MLVTEKKITLSNEKVCVFRSPVPEDAGAVLDFLRTTAIETSFLTRYPEEITITVEEESKKLDALRTDPLSTMIAVFCEDRLIGLAGIDPVAYRSKLQHRASLGIAILSDYWRMGIGGLLLNELSFLAVQMGFEQIELSVHRSNSRAIQLYRRHNFEVYGRLDNAIKFKDGTYCDEYFMVKNLNLTND